jgi:hypothetical protein
VAGYEDVNDADRLRHDPLLQIVADQKLGNPLGSQPTLSRWENSAAARDLVHLSDSWCEQFIRLCGDQVRKRGEILLDLDSTDDPTHGQQQLSFFNGAYGQHKYHPMLIFERHTGCLLAARLRPGNASSHARIVPMLLRPVPRLEAAFPGVKIRLRGDAGFALPLLYAFCEFFDIEYAIGIPANCVFQQRAEPRQKQLKRRYGRTQVPQRSFSSFRHRARSWPRQRRICYKAEHSAAGTNLRFVVTNGAGRAAAVFAFYNDRGECENRIEEFKNGFRADRLSSIDSSPTPSACCCTPPPTTWSTSSGTSYRSPGARPRSKPCAPSCSKSAPASARPLAASAFTWPRAGPFKLSSATRCWLATPANLPSASSNFVSPAILRSLVRKTIRITFPHLLRIWNRFPARSRCSAASQQRW